MAELDTEVDIPEPIEKVVPVDPLMTLLQLRFEYTSTLPSLADKSAIQAKMMAIVKENSMSPYYALLCELFGWPLDKALFDQMEKKNAEKLLALDAKIRDAEENLGDSDVRDSLLEKADFYGLIGDREQCMKFNEECSQRTLGVGPRLDLAFQRIRVGFAFSDTELVVKGIAQAQEMLKTHGDWERRNRLKVYEGLYLASTRNFPKAAELLLDSVATFSCYELINYRTFIFTTTVVSLVVLDRPTLKKKIIDCSDVVAILPEIPAVQDLLKALYSCQYRKVFPSLTGVCQLILESVFLSPHANYFFREIRVRAFQQFLESYRSVTLQSMSNAFAIKEDVLDHQLCCFIASGRLCCRIDKVSGNVLAEKVDKVNEHYHKILKNGDILLNRIQKLSRVAGM
jgi:26S proteasome regulatory subunit N7